MRREHSSILTEVLKSLTASIDQATGPLHITALAAQTNLPHDRLKAYLQELASVGLVDASWPPRTTARGRQFLLCYHAWLRIEQMYGLRRPDGQPGPATMKQATATLTDAPVAPLSEPLAASVKPRQG